MARSSRPGEASRRGRGPRGYTYFVVMLWVAVTGIGAASVGTMWHTAQQRERERELLAVGEEFRRAIGSYHASPPSGQRRYPPTLDDLVLDPRHIAVRRHLRRIYADPVNPQGEWGLVRAPDGGIMGVHSLSTAPPFKRAGFSEANKAFAEATRYSDWQFVFRAPTQPSPPVGWKAAPERPN